MMKYLSGFLILFVALLLGPQAHAAYVGEISSVPLGSYNDQWRVPASTSALILDDVSGGSDLTQTEMVNIGSDAGGTYCTIRLGNPGTTENVYLGDIHQIGNWYAGAIQVNTQGTRCDWAYNFTDTSFAGGSPGDDSTPPASGNSCVDTDGGQDADVRGTNSGTYNQNTFSVQDYCLANGADLLEYYCNGDSNADTIITCDNGCQDGACLPAPQPNTCGETDNGNDEDTRGTNTGTYNGNSYSAQDYCLVGNTRLLEYFCNGTTNDNDTITCENGCQDGACLPPPVPEEDACGETDNGNDSGTRGTNTGFYNGNAFTAEDYCMSAPNMLNEYVCNGTQNSSVQLGCVNGCQDGACLSEPAFDPSDVQIEEIIDDRDSTIDSDEMEVEIETFVPTCSEPDWFMQTVQGAELNHSFPLSSIPNSANDYCADSETVHEYACSIVEGDIAGGSGAPYEYEDTCPFGCFTNGNGQGQCSLAIETHVPKILRPIVRFFALAPARFLNWFR